MHNNISKRPATSVPLPSSPLPTQTPLSTSIASPLPTGTPLSSTIHSHLSHISHERATLLTRLQDLQILERDLLAQLGASHIAEQENYQPGSLLGISLSSYRFSDSSHTIEAQSAHLDERDFAFPLDSDAITDSNNSTGTQIRHRVRTPLSTVPKRVLRGQDASSELGRRGTGRGVWIQPSFNAPSQRGKRATTGPRMMLNERQNRGSSVRTRPGEETRGMLRTRSEGFGKKVRMEVGSEPETKAKAKTVAKTVAKTKMDVGTKTEAGTKMEPRMKSQTKAKLDAKTKTETKLEAKTATKAATAKTKTETKLETKPTPKTATKTATKAASRTKTPTSKIAQTPHVTVPTTVARKRWVF